MIVDRYYYGKLPDEEKSIYKEIYQGCMEHRDIISVTNTGDDLAKSYQRIIDAIMDDNPLLYFVNQSYINIGKDASGTVAVMPQYFFSAENVAIYNKKIQDAANRIIADLKLTEGDDAEKVRKVHDYMCTNVKYNHDNSGMKNVAGFIADHNIIGVFAHKKAKCEGIAKAVKVLLNAVDVRCIYVSGKGRDKKGKTENHGWNIVSIDGDPYHMDVTYDIGAMPDGNISYDYMNVTDTQIRRNHIFSTGYPKCNLRAANYFEMNDLVFSSKKELQDYIEKQIKAGARTFYFQLAGKLKAKEIWEEMLDYGFKILCDMGVTQAKGQHIINEDMNTCRLSYL